MSEQVGHASSETITVTLLNIRNLVSFVELDLLSIFKILVFCKSDPLQNYRNSAICTHSLVQFF